ncbi:hypothetical protein HWV07_09335 [Natronomonas salina]|uniref:hypothetical protein n=1 Tax=Natronomonas salina TaxID=1710540 RepID=UPI0015B4C3BD|nr:hypothetical protein [Natronomonas salina]QLD89221.1 hypothetical protein HWV07_09335 [Natronomonas salina]
MVSRRTQAALLAVVGLLLVTNSIWLFPHAGESEYTYERSEITVEDGTITYDGIDNRRFHRRNNLQDVGCQRTDREGERACAFDEYLADNPPVTVSRQLKWGHATPDFVEINGDYYRRIHRPNDSNVTHDVTQVPPRSVLTQSAADVSGHSIPDRSTTTLEHYAAVSGETVTSFEELERDDLGRIYLQNGTFYTVVGTDRSINHPGPEFRQYQALRYVLGFVGVVLLLIGTHIELTREGD